MIKFRGKLIGDTQYFHRSATKLLSLELQNKIKECTEIVTSSFDWNVVKINLKDRDKISLLVYESFSENAFPALLNSCQVDIKNQTFFVRNHSPHNPPILHRKELLLAPDDKQQVIYCKLTKQLEDIGAFENISIIGTKKNWEKELENLGVKVINHYLVDLDHLNTKESSTPVILRFRTAISRNALSIPAKILYQSGIANEDHSYLDYGCGRGDDVAFLTELNITATGWDPHFNNKRENLKSSDIVNLGFVLNVIEDPAERIQVLNAAFSVAKKCLSVGVMLKSQNDPSVSVPFSDGQLTSIKTFQKYYDQKEIEQFLKSELKFDPIAAAPGVFFIFKDEALEQDFLLKRQLGIIRDYEPRNLVSKINEKKEKTQLALRMVNNLARHTLAFARKPDLEELPKYFRDQLEKTEISYRRAFDAASQLITESQLKEAVSEKRDQLTLFFAMYFFSSRPKYKKLTATLQKDIRLHFGSMKDLEKDAKGLLYSLGNAELLLGDSIKATGLGLGYYQDEKFTFSSKKLKKIPIRLRGVVAIAERLAGTIEGDDLIRIHIESKKVSYIKVENFDLSPLPRMLARTIVKFRRNEIINLDHCKDGRVKTVYLKSRWMSATDPNYKVQSEFDELILNSLDLDFTGEGPKFEQFAKALMDHKIVLPEYKK